MTEPSLHISLLSQYPNWLLLPLIGAAAWFGYWSYRRTTPPIGSASRVILSTLRSIALAAAIWFIWQPVFEIRRDFQMRTQVALLVDNSRSMALNQAGIDRPAVVRKLLGGQALRALDKEHSVAVYPFADTLGGRVELGGTELLRFEGAATNIASSLVRLDGDALQEKIGAIILVTDGANNSGPDPVRVAHNRHTPIYAIGVGSEQTSLDLMVTDVNAGPVVYQGSKVPVEIGYRATGAAGTRFELRLFDASGKLLGQTSIDATAPFVEGRASFEIVADHPGKLQYRVEIPTRPGELTADNNRRSFYLNVLTSKMRVLVVAGEPDQSLGDLVRRLRADEHIEVTQRTSRGNGYYEGPPPDNSIFDRVDVVVLHHYPPRDANRSEVERIASLLAKSELPVWFVDGGPVDMQNLKPFSGLMPVKPSAAPSTLISAQVVPIRRHAIIAEPDDLDYAAKWANLPPLQFKSGGYAPVPGAEILAEFAGAVGVKYPALVISDAGGRKSAALLADDFWRWGLASAGTEGVTEPLVDRLIRWLAARKSARRVQIAFDKDQYSTQEAVAIRAAVYDENYQPQDGAQVEANVAGNGREPARVVLKGIGDGRYSSDISTWGEGEYSIKISAARDGQAIGADSGKVMVEPFTVELLDTRLNSGLLRSIAEASGGKYAPADSAEALLASIDLPIESRHEETHRTLWGGWWHLGVIVGLLAVEWTIRVRIGML